MTDADIPPVTYEFAFEDRTAWTCSVPMNTASDWPLRPPLPAWTRLEHCQCDHCPLRPEEIPHCPFAAALVEPVEAVWGRASFETVAVTVQARDRQTRVDTTLQRAMGSLLGLLGAMSGCPHTRLLRPMARHHLPFSSAGETRARVIGTYLAGQYVRRNHGLQPDWDLRQLRQAYSGLRQVNQGMSRRLRSLDSEDTGVNSLVLLDLLAADVGYMLEDYDGEMDSDFREFLEQP